MIRASCLDIVFCLLSGKGDGPFLHRRRDLESPSALDPSHQRVAVAELAENGSDRLPGAQFEPCGSSFYVLAETVRMLHRLGREAVELATQRRATIAVGG